MARASVPARALLPILVLTALFALPPGTSHACDAATSTSFGLSPGCFDQQVTAEPTATNLAPDFTQAGGHPFQLTATLNFNENAAADDSLRNVFVRLPPGFVADSRAVVSCTLVQLAEFKEPTTAPGCPPSSQVGELEAQIRFGEDKSESSFFRLPLYKLITPPGGGGRFGAAAFGTMMIMDARVDPGSRQGIVLRIRNIDQLFDVNGNAVVIKLWGVPADPLHTPNRSCSFELPPSEGGPTCGAGIPPRPFLRMPTACTGPVESSVAYDSWGNPGVMGVQSVLSHRSPGLLGDPTDLGTYPLPYPGLDSAQWGPPQGFTGCSELPFSPSMSVDLGTEAANTPTGVSVDLAFPLENFEELDGVAESDLRAASISFPPDVTVNTAVANGLGACTAAQVGLGSDVRPACPDSAKLGTVEVRTPLVASVLEGSIYLAEPSGRANAPRLPVYVVAGTGDLTIKLQGEVDVDEATGRVTAAFADAPQLPLWGLKLNFFGGDRSPFVSPVTCGSYSFDGSFSPWSGNAPVTAGDRAQVSSGFDGAPCPAGRADRPFHPGFSSGSTNPVAGESGSFLLRLTRGANEQELSSLDVSLPAGVSASLRGIPYCPEASIAAASAHSAAAEIAAPSCPAESQVGRVSAALGAGNQPFHLDTGKVYLSGPYKGAPVSFAVVIPALAGPLDLNTMALRLPLDLDSGNGRLTIKGGLPTVQEGIPLNMRNLMLVIDRPGLMRNPTRCRPTKIEGEVKGDAGAFASISTPFQVRGCGALRFAPKLAMKVLGGPGANAHRAHPKLRTVLTARKGDANFRRATVTLPRSQQLDPSHIDGVCLRDQFAADACPEDAVYGWATVRTPLLAEPLRGPVLMRASKGRFPDLLVRARGQLNLDLRGKVGFAGGRLRLVFERFPDIPLSKLSLTIAGGKRGILVNNRSLCAAPSLAEGAFKAQNGRSARPKAPLQVDCAS